MWFESMLSVYIISNYYFCASRLLWPACASVNTHLAQKADLGPFILCRLFRPSILIEPIYQMRCVCFKSFLNTCFFSFKRSNDFAHAKYVDTGPNRLSMSVFRDARLRWNSSSKGVIANMQM